jgi:hypothetical protein
MSNFFKTVLQVSVVALAIAPTAYGQYLMVESLQDELMCRVAVRGCLKPVECLGGGRGDVNYCWQNQCTFKKHLTVGFRDTTFSLNIGDILKSSVQDPFQFDFNAPIRGSRVLDCKDPAMAKSIIKTRPSALPKTTLESVMELSAKR